MEAHSRLYKIFTSIDEVVAPYEVARQLSNGEVVAELNRELGEPQGDEISNDEALEYIKNNHVEPNIEEF
jgi:hypothetical protein